jgi:hypothetical protein
MLHTLLSESIDLLAALILVTQTVERGHIVETR